MWRPRRAGVLWLLPVLVAGRRRARVGDGRLPALGRRPRARTCRQAWSCSTSAALSPYSYFYDHAPAGWIQIALWSMLTGGFDRHDSAIGVRQRVHADREGGRDRPAVLLARRLRLRPARRAAAAGLLFGLCPLELVYSRWTFLDNLVTPWMLLAFVLAYSPRRA